MVLSLWLYMSGQKQRSVHTVRLDAEMKAAWNAVISYNLISSFLNAKKKNIRVLFLYSIYVISRFVRNFLPKTLNIRITN